MSPLFKESPEFHKLLTDGDRPSLAKIALEIARDAYPELDFDRYLGELDGNCRASPGAVRGRVEAAEGPGPDQLGARSSRRVTRAIEDNYFDPRNSYLNEVIDRKKGIPISLSILYGSVAERLGLVLHGANLPAHFMLRLGDSPEPLFIDPFHSGELLDRRRLRSSGSRA